MEHTKPVRYIVTPEGRLLMPSCCWEVTLTGNENTFNYRAKNDQTHNLDYLVRKVYGGKDLKLPEPPADFEYAVEWINNTGEVKHDYCGRGEHGQRVAEAVATSTRNWQERQGMPVDARVVYRPVNAWKYLGAE